MRTRNARWATSAAIVLAIGAAVLVLNNSVSRAYAVERVIAAYKSIRYLHVKTFSEGKEQPAEFWIQSDGAGHVTKARYYLPETEDGIKLITWSPDRAEIWFKSKRRFQTFQTKRIEGWMQSLLEQGQPQLVLEKLLEGKKAGKVDIHMQEPQGGQKAVIMVATHKSTAKREKYWIDPKTELITQIEHFRIENGNEVLKSRTEFSDYNVTIDEKMFSLKEELPKDVRVSDQLSQPVGVPQDNMTDEQAATETVRQFFQALQDKDYRKAGLIVGGEVEEHARAEFGIIKLATIISIGPAQAQTDWVKRGFKVPCKLQIIHSDGEKAVWEPQVFVRPGDDEAHPDRWNITGGINPHETEIKLLPDNVKYEKMFPREAATAFFKACAEENWTEFAKFSPLPASDPRLEQLKKYLGGLEIISLGEGYKGTNGYAGWYVPYEIRFRPQIYHMLLSNDNSARRYVVTGVYDSDLKLQQDYDWAKEPALLPDNDIYSKMSPLEVAKAYLRAQANFEWDTMRKFASEKDVEQTKRQIEAAQKRGVDVRNLPVWEALEAFWSKEHSAWFVKCRVSSVKKWNLALRNDNPTRRFIWDGGL